MNDPFLGMIAMFGFNWAPRGWALCNGQILSVSQNQALYALLGNMYGGDGVSTFALPNLQGKIPIGFGQGLGLSMHTQGQTAGSALRTLLIQNLPAHSHTIAATNEAANSASPDNTLLANSGTYDKEYKVMPTQASKKPMNTGAMRAQGGSQPIGIMQPYTTINYCIALQGVFPSRP